MKGSLKRLYEKNEVGNIIKTHIERQSIEDSLIDFNTNHFKKVFQIEVHKDKICPKLQENAIRDKIIRGES